MRPAYWIVGGLLVLVVALFTFWPAPDRPYEDSPPGQYPLDQGRPAWTATQSIGSYRPGATMGSNALTGIKTKDAKFGCATSSTCVF